MKQESGQARHLTDPEKRLCRGLWEEIFSEDSEAFLDYYDKWKYPENKCFGIFDGERLVSMLQLNPYEVQVKASPSVIRTIRSCYIIAVATRAEYRHRGLMSRLLKESLGSLRKQGMPFVFLMPAAEAIYRPFGFRYFYDTNAGELPLHGGSGAEAHGAVRENAEGDLPLQIRPAELSDVKALAAFSEELQGELFDCFTKRDCRYYEMLLAELRSEGGCLLLLTEEAGAKRTETAPAEQVLPETVGYGPRILAAVPCWGEDPVEIREILCRPCDKERVLQTLSRWFASASGGAEEKVSIVGAAFELEKKKPVIMGRIVDIASFLALFSSERPMELLLEVSDELLEENEGLYLWKLSPEGSMVLRQNGVLRAAELQNGKSQVPGGISGSGAVRLDAAELFSCLMGSAGPGEALGGVRTCRKIYINEVV